MIISTKITADLINLNPTTGYYEFNETVSGKVIFEYCGGKSRTPYFLVF